MTKPLDALPNAFRALGKGIEGGTLHATRATAKLYEARTEEQGGKHYITSPRRQKIPLDRVDAKQTQGGVMPVFEVSPQAKALGLWVIVERGSAPHVILPRGMARKVKRLDKALNAGRRLTRGQAQMAASLVTGVGLFAGVKPLRVDGIGPRYAVQHPGHKPLGSPWRDGVASANRDAEETFDDALAEYVIDRYVAL